MIEDCARRFVLLKLLGCCLNDCDVCVDQSQLFTWGFGILGKGPKLGNSLTPEQIPETLFGANEWRQSVKLVDVQCGLHHFAVLTGK